MREKFLSGLAFFTVFIFVISIWALLIQFIGVQDDHKATIIAGVLGMIGGITGAMGAYFAAKMQIDTQMKRLNAEDKKRARPFIVCNDFRGTPNLSEVILHPDSKIIDFGYHDELARIIKQNGERKIGFFQLKFLGKVDVILNCKIKLFLDETAYEESQYDAYLDHMKNDVEVFIPIPYVTKPKFASARPVRLELTFDTIENEKFIYIYNFSDKYFKLSLIENDGEQIIFIRDFGEAQWILPGRKK